MDTRTKILLIKSNKIKFIILSFLILSNSNNLIAQKNNKIDNTKISIFYPGISIEKGIGLKGSIYVQAFYTYSKRLPTKGGGSSRAQTDPSASFQYRYYYNNDENDFFDDIHPYFAGLYKVTFSKKELSYYRAEEKRRAINVFGLVYGGQVFGNERFCFDGNLGIGYLFSKVSFNKSLQDSITISAINNPVYVTKRFKEIIPIAQISIGFWLNKRKK